MFVRYVISVLCCYLMVDSNGRENVGEKSPVIYIYIYIWRLVDYANK